MKYIETLREGERVGEVFLCKHKQTALTKNGKPYENLILQDKTGTLDAKILSLIHIWHIFSHLLIIPS